MTKLDIDHLFELLAIYRPRDKQLANRKIRNAWFLVLEPFRPELVKQATVECLRSSRFLPDVTDIALRCQELEPAPPEPAPQAPAAPPLGRAEQLHLEQSRAWQEQWHQHLHTLGLPSLREALENGWSLPEWNQCLAEHGAWEPRPPETPPPPS